MMLYYLYYDLEEMLLVSDLARFLCYGLLYMILEHETVCSKLLEISDQISKENAHSSTLNNAGQ